MRVYEDRYQRDWQRFHVALRFIRLEARTRTIRLWTGLSDDRIRKLYRSYLAEGRTQQLAQHRGKSPQRIALFMRSTRLRQESALLASLCRLLGALPAPEPGQTLALPSLSRAELLCQAYEMYRALVDDAPLLDFERAVFLLSALARGEELVCGHCEDCHALLVVDRYSLRAHRCELCAEAPAVTQGAAPAATADETRHGSLLPAP